MAEDGSAVRRERNSVILSAVEGPLTPGGGEGGGWRVGRKGRMTKE